MSSPERGFYHDDRETPETNQALDILRTIRGSSGFEQTKDSTNVRLLRRDINGSGEEPTVPVDDFLQAVDYYVEHKDPEAASHVVNNPHGSVPVFAGRGNGYPYSALTLPNRIVPPMLEFAYQLVRKEQISRR